MTRNIPKTMNKPPPYNHPGRLNDNDQGHQLSVQPAQLEIFSITIDNVKNLSASTKNPKSQGAATVHLITLTGIGHHKILEIFPEME